MTAKLTELVELAEKLYAGHVDARAVHDGKRG
jgi:hypothetical protein